MRRVMNKVPAGKDHWLFLENHEIAQMVETEAKVMSNVYWSGGRGWEGEEWPDFRRLVTGGDESLVERTEKVLGQIEDQIPRSKGWRNFDDVVGAVPNIPAFLAGHPQCMRRRQRIDKETAPLAIYMDLTSSVGISQSLIEKRGVVLLALARLLVDHRPVELWVGTSIGDPGLASNVAWRIETSPLDMARAAYHIAATAMSRRFGYGVAVSEHYGSHRWKGKWAFGDYDTHRATIGRRLELAFTGQELIHVPAIFYTDPMTTDPVAWIKRTLRQYVNQEEDE